MEQQVGLAIGIAVGFIFALIGVVGRWANDQARRDAIERAAQPETFVYTSSGKQPDRRV